MSEVSAEKGLFPQRILGKDDFIVGDNEVYSIGLWDDKITTVDKTKAYLKGDYYYVYQGTLDSTVMSGKTPPGIYWDSVKKVFELKHPETPEEMLQYSFENKISTLDPKKIVERVNNHEVELTVITDSNKQFLPGIDPDDDILKRLVKHALRQKGIDIDCYKHRFTDKNALFNFKQVVKGPNRLSMLLFDRGTEALNLRYTIVLEEIDPLHPVGAPLKEKLVASSDDVFEI